MSKNTHIKDLKITKLPDAEAEITGALTVEYLGECRAEALKSLNQSHEIPGFRKGNVPEDVLVKHIGEMHVLEEVAEVALGREYPLIIEEAKLSPIGRPTISITKLAPGVPLEFKIVVALEPEFELPDYKKIAKSVTAEADETEVTDKEVADVIEELKKQDVKAELKDGETLESRVKENLTEEKKFRAREKKRLKIVEELVKATDITVPKVIVESEMEKMFLQFKDDVERVGMKFDEYLANLKKTPEEIKNEWEPQAKDRAKAEMIVAKISEKEKIEPTPEEVEHEAKHVLSHYPDADPLRVRIYVFTMIRNQKVLEYLEGIK
jgi:FKBP-type peptidyl-prolyl cis-trans isomerase (trigger factor)